MNRYDKMLWIRIELNRSNRYEFESEYITHDRINGTHATTCYNYSTGRKIQQVALQANNDLHGSTWLDDVAYKGLQDFFPQLRRYTGWCLTLSAKCHESSVEHDIPKTDSYTKNWTDRNAARKGLSQLSKRTKSLPNTMNTMTWPSCLRFAFSLRTRLSLLN